MRKQQIDAAVRKDKIYEHLERKCIARKTLEWSHADTLHGLMKKTGQCGEPDLNQ